MAFSSMLAKEWYKDKSVEELEEMWNGITKKLIDKETFLYDLVENFMDASNSTNTNSSRQAVKELLKEKTGKDYSIDENCVYELEYAYKMKVEYAKMESLPIIEKETQYLLTFNDVFNFTMKDNNDPFWKETFKNFYDKLDFVSEGEKLELLLTLYHDKEDNNNLSKDLTSNYDIKSLYSKYKELANKYYSMNHTIG